VAYVLVTSPDPLSIREVLYFSDRLREQRMPRDAIVVNRVHATSPERPDQAAVRAELQRRAIRIGADGEGRVLRARDDEAIVSDLDRRHLEALAAFDQGANRPIRVEVPAFAGDVHDIKALARVAQALADS
jgi:anion-transporting  ArsA/GET3 family ATPase